MVAVCCAALLGLSVGLSSAAPTLTQTRLKVSFKTLPNVIYNRLGDSTLSVISAEKTQTVRLSGTVDPQDENYWKVLTPINMRLALARGQDTVTLRTRLFVCDKTRGICSIQTQQQQLKVKSGNVNTVILDAPQLTLNGGTP